MSGDRILVIDDNFLHLKLVRVLLAADGHELVTTLNAEDGLLALRLNVPTLILVDVDLPGMDGLTFTRLVRDDPRTRHVPIVVVSSRGSAADRARALDAGATLVLPKPIDTRTFADTIASLVRASRVAVPRAWRSAPVHWDRETVAS